MSEFLKEFLKDPVAFGEKRPFTVLGPGRRLTFKEKEYTHDDETFTGYQVSGADRIHWFDIERMRGDLTLFEVQLQNESEQGLRAAYWLPWAEDQIFRTTLRPSKKAKDDLKDVDPDYFFTAALNGCSVFVEGARDQPTVYHANAKSHSGTFATDLTKKQFIDLQIAKIAEMEKRFVAFSTQQEKLSRGGVVRQGPGPSGRESTMFDYMSRAHSPHFSKELEDVVSKATNGQYTKVEVAGQKIVVTDAEGTVFGVRVKGEWTFYFQKRVRIRHLVNDYESSVSNQGTVRWGLSFLNPVDYWDWAKSNWKVQAEMWLPLTCKEFWPNGAGSVVMREG